MDNTLTKTEPLYKATQRPTGTGKRLTLPEKILILAEKGIASSLVIAKKYGVSDSTVRHIWRDKKLKNYDKEVAIIKEGIADKFYVAADAGVNQFLKVVEKASPKDAAIAAGVLYDKARLADGKSTENHLHGFLNICNEVPI